MKKCQKCQGKGYLTVSGTRSMCPGMVLDCPLCKGRGKIFYSIGRKKRRK